MRAAVLVAIGAALLLGAFTWAGTLFNGDEATYALFARGLRQGDWLHLRLGGEILHQRPPLYPWLLALSTGALGENAFAWRLPAVIFGAGTAGVVVLLARRVVSLGPAVTAGLLHPTLALAFRYGRAVVSDAPLTFFCAAAIHCWWDAASRRRAAIWAGVFLGGALMTKQVVGLLPLLAPVVQLCARDAPRRAIVRRSGWVLAVGAAIAAPWHVFMWARHGSAFLEGYVGYNVVRRTAQSILPDTTPAYYLEVLWQQEHVIVGAFAIGVAVCLWRRGTWLLFPAWVLAVLLPFTLASSRIDYYLLPALPALAVAAVAPLSLLSRPALRLAAGGALVLTSAALHLPQRITDVHRHPEIAAIATAARGGEGPLVVIDDLPFSPALYAERPVILVVTSRSAYERVRSIDLFAVPGNLRHVPRSELPSFLASLGTYAVIESKKSASRHPLPPGALITATVPGYLLYQGQALP
jgi:4-amino-4-deoxy-L-arabinose transferase-like glycosyltransferase